MTVVRFPFLFLSFFLSLFIWPASLSAFDLKAQVKELKLRNGMHWLIVQRSNAPVFSGVVMVRVGGVDEVPGKTGLAHMFEHMAFKGSRQIGTKNWRKEKPLLDEIERLGEEITLEEQKASPDPKRLKELFHAFARLEKRAGEYQVKNEVWELLVQNGGADLNAFTTKDLTAFHASMPAGQLALWAKVFSGMVFDPVYRDFYTERKVVAEERRQSVENNPDGMMSEELLDAAFSDGPFSWSTIGFEKDILGLIIADARRFHERHYVPENMVGVLVGAVDPASARGILERYFGVYKGGKPPSSPQSPGKEKKGVSEKLLTPAGPSLALAFHKPTLPKQEEYVFDVIDALLCEGRTSRLQKRLIYEKKLVGSLYCTVGFPGSRLHNLFLIWAEPFATVKPKVVREEILDVIEGLQEERVGDEELTRVRKRVMADFIFSLEKNMHLAENLAEFSTVFGDWRLLTDYPERIAKVSAEEIMEVTKQYLRRELSIVVERTRGTK